MKAGATTVFRLERENSWIAHTPTDNYFLVDERAKEVIEFLERSSSTEQAWENYQSRALVAPRVTESRFHDIRHLITRGSPKKITAVTGLSARRIIFSKSNTIQLSAAISILSPRQSLLPVSLSFVVMALLALQHGFSRPVAGGLMQTVSTVILVACSLFVHELGHASALARAGGRPGAITFGLRFYVYPCLATDVSNAWMLAKRERMLVNLGGVYFQSIFSILLYVASYLAPSYVATTIADAACICAALCLFQLVPFPHSDGHWVAKDLGAHHLNSESRAGKLLTLGTWLSFVWIVQVAVTAIYNFILRLLQFLDSGNIPPDAMSIRTLYSAMLVASLARSANFVIPSLYRRTAHLYRKFTGAEI